MIEEDPLSDIPSEALDRELEDYYDLLQVQRRAAQSEIKRAYREKIQEYHPDRSDNEYAESITFALNQAKSTLLNQNERVRYNEIGHNEYYSQSLTSSNIESGNTDTDQDDYQSSIYELIKLAKVDDYTKEPWWKTVIKSKGFKVTVGVIGFLVIMLLLFLYI